MKTHTNSHSPEILETRIAPAVFFLHGNNLTITDSTGADVAGSADETSAAAAAGATKVVLLSAGDSLFFDLNGDNDAGDAGDRSSRR